MTRRSYQVESQLMISFKGAQYPKDVILFAVFFYVRYGVSYRDLEEIMAERGVSVDHTTLNRWVTRYSCAIAETARRRKGPCDRSWRMDETYIKVKGSWVYLYRAIDKHGKTLDFMLSQRRNKPAATKFFARMLEVNALPRKIVIDKSGANTAGIKAINKMLNGFGCPIPIEMVRRKYLNNIVEQDHRFIKRRIRPMLGFKAFASAAATLDEIEVAHMIRTQRSNHARSLSVSAICRAGRLARRYNAIAVASQNFATDPLIPRW